MSGRHLTVGEFCNEPVSPVQASDSNFAIPHDQFMTAKLWDACNSSPYGHRGDLDTIFAAIINHSGEATRAESQFEALPDPDQAAIVRFTIRATCQFCRHNRIRM